MVDAEIKKNKFTDLLAEELKNPKSKKLFTEYSTQLEIAMMLVQLRSELGLNQRQLAKQVGVPQSTIARIENSDTVPKIETLIQIASAVDKKLVISFR